MSNVIGLKNNKRYRLNKEKLYGTSVMNFRDRIEEITGSEFIYITSEHDDNEYDDVDYKYWEDNKFVLTKKYANELYRKRGY